MFANKLLLLIIAAMLSSLPTGSQRPGNLPDEIEYAYTIEGDEVYITGYNGEGTQLNIPATLEGKPVTKIAAGAFAGKAGITSVSVPSSVKEIENRAFKGCTSLSGLTLSEGLESLGEWVFSETKLESVELPASLSEMGGAAFYYNKSLHSAYFKGNPPEAEIKPFIYNASGFTVYYTEGAEGWGEKWMNYTTKQADAPEPTQTPEPTASAEPTSTPLPTGTDEPTQTPEPTATSEPTTSPSPSGQAEFTTPTEIANPANADEEFFNFRLKEFAPSTEEMINEVLGDETVFEQGGFWNYESYYSHAVGFGTNLPTLSIVEYGETRDLGSFTEQSDSYYYRHLHYIKGLQPGKTYYYRLHVQGYDGRTVSGDILSFNTKELTDDVIRIPQDMPNQSAPYILDKEGAKYLLTEDIAADTLAINIKGSNIELDLGGNTVTYDNGSPTVTGDFWDDYTYNEDATFGIRAGLWNKVNQKIFNGTVKQGANGGSGYIGLGFNPIFLFHMHGDTKNEIAGVTVDYYGDSVSGMITGNGYFHHNVIHDRGTVVDNRHQGIKAMETENGIDNRIEYNSLRRFRHQGIVGGGDKKGNEVYSDSFDSNSFLISVKDGDVVEDNILLGMGYNPVGFSWASNSVVRDNFVYIHGTAPTMRSTEYDRVSAIAGIRLTDYGGSDEVYKNINYESNTIVLKAYEGCSAARCIWASSTPNTQNVFFKHNYLKVEAMSDNLNPDVSNSYASVEINGDHELVPEIPLIFEDNTMVSNVQHINFGTSYGIGHSAWFYRSKLERINHHDGNFVPLRLGFWYWDTTNNRLIDTECGEGVDITTLPKFIGSDGHQEVAIGESCTLTFKQDDGTLLPEGKQVVVKSGELEFTIDVGEGGKATFDLITLLHRKKDGQTPAETVSFDTYEFTFSGITVEMTAAELKQAGEIRFEE